MPVQIFTLTGPHGTLRGDLTVPDAPASGPRPLAVIVHGFKGFREWGPWGAIADKLAEYGMLALRFDFSHNGLGDDGVDFSALDRFEANTVSFELDELHAILTALGEGTLGEIEVPPVSHTFLIGHSRGGGVALAVASEVETGRLAGVASWAAISRFERDWPAEAWAQWRAGKSFEIPNQRTNQMMPIGAAYIRDLESNKARFDLHVGMQRLAAAGTPLLILHGTDDPTVDIGEANELRAWAKEMRHPDVTSHNIDGANHAFGARHPFQGWTPHLEDAFGATLAFMRAHATPASA